ncbi:hypothetical protein ACFL1E_01800 [Candidatus Omnitrophota bacterium]
MRNDIFQKKQCIASAIGSMSLKDPEEACGFIIETFQNDLIFWPQLPRRSFYENMYVQYSEGLPGVVIDEKNQRIFVDTSAEKFMQELEASYQAYEQNDIDYFSMSQKCASGLYAMLRLLPKLTSFSAIKGQVIGPISFALSVTDQDKQPLMYNADVFEIITKTLAMKARWQIRKLKESNALLRTTVVFIDEPYLVSIGSSFVALKKEQVISSINAVIKAIHEEGALAGIHCCGNTDWSIVLETDLDILNFDAYSYAENLFLYKDVLKSFVDRKGIIAWGIVPTSQDVELNEGSAKKLVEKLTTLSKEKNISLTRCLITPSCGCGSITSDELNILIHALTVKTANLLSR